MTAFKSKIIDKETLLENLDRIEETKLEGEDLISANKVVDRLKLELEHNKELNSLTAPQIGKNKRIAVLRFDDQLKTIINPMIVEKKDLKSVIQDSIISPDEKYLTFKFSEITVCFQDATGNVETNIFKDTAAYILQQNINLLDGIVDDLIGLKIEEDFLNASEEEQNEVIEIYAKSLQEQGEELNEEIKADPELSKLKDGIDFLTSVATGETKIEKEQQKPISITGKLKRLVKKLTNRKKRKEEKKQQKIKEREEQKEKYNWL